MTPAPSTVVDRPGLGPGSIGGPQQVCWATQHGSCRNHTPGTRVLGMTVSPLACTSTMGTAAIGGGLYLDMPGFVQQQVARGYVTMHDLLSVQV